MESPFSRVRKIFFRGRNLQENPRNSAERAIFAKFQAPKFENSEPEKMQFRTPSHSIPPLDSRLGMAHKLEPVRKLCSRLLPTSFGLPGLLLMPRILANYRVGRGLNCSFQKGLSPADLEKVDILESPQSAENKEGET